MPGEEVPSEGEVRDADRRRVPDEQPVDLDREVRAERGYLPLEPVPGLGAEDDGAQQRDAPEAGGEVGGAPGGQGRSQGPAD